MSFNVAVIPMLLLLVLGCGPLFWAMREVSKEVSREKLNQLEDLSKLWKNSFPPSELLTERGLKIQHRCRIFIIGLGAVVALIGYFVTGFSLSPIVNASQ